MFQEIIISYAYELIILSEENKEYNQKVIFKKYS